MRTVVLSPWTAFAALIASLAPVMAAAQTAPRISLAKGLAIAHTEQGVGGERESVTAVEDATTAGVKYGWSYREITTNGDTAMGRAGRFVSTADLTGAARMHLIYDPKGPAEHPGYTAWTVSSAVYQQLRTSGSAPFQMMTGEHLGAALPGLSLAAPQIVPVRWRGTLTRVGTGPTSFPLLVNGRRVSVPALHARAEFSARGDKWTPDLWILADSTHPLLLKVVSVQPPKSFQVIRVDLPDERGPATAAGGMRAIEGELTTRCRVELPGIYFAFNSASLDPVSDRTIASVAAMLSRHRDWKVTIEGHTDSIGNVAANRTLSERRAAAVRERLMTTRRVDGSQLRSIGVGASTPREPNATVEGRARNRRVELARDCRGT